MTGSGAGNLQASPAFAKAIAKAEAIAKKQGGHFITQERLLQGIV